MKRFLTSLFTLLFLLSLVQVNAQTARTALVEEATQASCPPCATFNPQVQALVNDNAENTIFMGYQVSWPGFDQMNLDNPTEVAARVSYYGITGAPSIVVQGTNFEQTFNQSQLNNATADESEFAITLNAEVVLGELIVTGNVEATLAASGDFKLRIALLEDLITIEDAPGGTNGETEYHHVFKKFLGGSAGISLANEWAVGDTYEINETLALDPLTIYHFEGLEVVAFIQNDTDKYVHQATKVSNLDITVELTTNGTGVALSGTPAALCSGEQTITPVFTLQNGGNDELTSADIVYSVNGGAEQTVAWTGSLATLSTEKVTLDPITFMAGAEGNVVNARVENPNGATDENADDNAVETVIGGSALSTNIAELTLITDNYGNETYWQVTDGAGMVVASGGNAGVGLTNTGVGAGAPPTDPGAYGNNQTIVVEIPLESAGCYSFSIGDYWGDGICCGFGEGSYVLRDSDGEIMFSGGEFAATNDDPFEASEPVGVKEDQEFVSTFSVSPNPVINTARVDFNILAAATTTISVINALGQEVQRQELGKIAAGNHNLNLDMSNLNAGVYMINIISGDVKGTQKVMLAK